MHGDYFFPPLRSDNQWSHYGDSKDLSPSSMNGRSNSSHESPTHGSSSEYRSFNANRDYEKDQGYDDVPRSRSDPTLSSFTSLPPSDDSLPSEESEGSDASDIEERTRSAALSMGNFLPSDDSFLEKSMSIMEINDDDAVFLSVISHFDLMTYCNSKMKEKNIYIPAYEKHFSLKKVIQKICKIVANNQQILASTAELTKKTYAVLETLEKICEIKSRKSEGEKEKEVDDFKIIKKYREKIIEAKESLTSESISFAADQEAHMLNYVHGEFFNNFLDELAVLE